MELDAPGAGFCALLFGGRERGKKGKRERGKEGKRERGKEGKNEAGAVMG
jgi:hypothetical protein